MYAGVNVKTPGQDPEPFGQVQVKNIILMSVICGLDFTDLAPA